MKSPVLAPLLFLCCVAACSGGDGDGANPILEFDAAPTVSALCTSPPTRMIVLGDSIAACFGVGDKNAATCGPKILHSYLEGNYAAGIEYENKAVSGAVTTDVPDKQLATVAPGPGHVIVLIYVGGNNLQQYLGQGDDAAIAGLTADLPSITADWESTLAYFSNSSDFPDGATVIMNNQYNPFDDCTAAPYEFISAAKIGLLADYNAELQRIADSHDNVVLTNQHTPYLGHGHHYQVATCPYYQAGSLPFMNDLIHPNNAGHAHLASQWQITVDELFAACD